jgi:hypothetical protein
METSSTTNTDEQSKGGGAFVRSNPFKIVLVISLSLNVFLFSSLAMYGTWLAASPLSDFWRGVVSLLVWISSFGAGAIVFWKIILGISAAGASKVKA